MDLVPVVAELSSAQPGAVDMECCRRFAAIFDRRGDGVIHEDEFLDFSRFLCIMSFLHSEEGQALASEGLQVMEGSMRIEELLAVLQNDARALQKVLPYLPAWLRKELYSDELAAGCLERFAELDVNVNGALGPREIFPVVIALAGAHSLALDLEQCERFAAIFDRGGTGALGRGDYVDLGRSLLVLAYLQSEDGQRLLQRRTASRIPANHHPEAAAEAAPRSLAPEDARRLAQDLAHQRRRAEQLQRDGEAERARASGLEAMVRRMEGRIEELQGRLQDAEHLRAVPG